MYEHVLIGYEYMSVCVHTLMYLHMVNSGTRHVLLHECMSRYLKILALTYTGICIRDRVTRDVVILHEMQSLSLGYEYISVCVHTLMYSHMVHIYTSHKRRSQCA